MTKIIIYILLSTFILLSNCSHYYYTPNSQTVPLFQEKGEAHISAATYGSKESDGFVINTTLALTDNIGVIGNYMYGDAEDDINWGRGNFSEIGIGMFEPAGSNTVIECYNGFGIGNVKNHYSNNLESKLSYYRYFIQPTFGYRSKIFEIAVSGRICFLSYNSVKYDMQLIEDYRFEDIQYIIDHDNFILFEPALTLRVGAERFKIQAQLVRSITEINTELKQEEVNLNLGFTISF